MVILNSLLKSLQKDLNRNEASFRQTPPMYGANSFGAVVFAASNNFRYHDEWTAQWVKEREFTDLQMKSVPIIASALGRTETEYRFLAGNVCPEVFLRLTF
jgi:hypothetical protein